MTPGPGVELVKPVHVCESHGAGLLGDGHKADHGVIGRGDFHVSVVDVADFIFHVALPSADPDITDQNIVVGDRGITALDDQSLSLRADGESFQFHLPVSLCVRFDGEIADRKPYSDVFPRLRGAPDPDGLVSLNYHVVTKEVSNGEFGPEQAGEGRKSQQEQEGREILHEGGISCPCKKRNGVRGAVSWQTDSFLHEPKTTERSRLEWSGYQLKSWLCGGPAQKPTCEEEPMQLLCRGWHAD